MKGESRGHRRAAGPSAALVACGTLLAGGGVAGHHVRRLKAQLERARADALEARGRAEMLERVIETVRGLLASPCARQEICRAATEIAGADAALIYEPGLGDGLRCSAMNGIIFDEHEGIVVPVTSGAGAAFDGGRSVFVDAIDERQVASAALWRAAGRPASVLYQPMVRAGASLGVLAVGWSRRVAPDGPHCAVVSLLAHEAAAVIAHADVVDALAGEARTDALTGLPNRRAWDTALGRALDHDAPLAVAILDFDRFKEFNDSFGHLAGDRLLKAGAAAWRSHLREGDSLARLGGEEFGVLLLGCALDEAAEIVDRLRRSVPDACTCSAGIAARRRGESAESLLDRADAALYEAKAAGRNRTRVSG